MPEKMPKVQNTHLYQWSEISLENKIKPFKNTPMEKENLKKQIKLTHLSPRPKIYPTMDMTAKERV